jgi:hypothetical protein
MKTLIAAALAGAAIATAGPAFGNPGDYIAIAASSSAAEFGVAASNSTQQRAIDMAMDKCAQRAAGATDCILLASGHDGCVAIGAAGPPGNQYAVAGWGYNSATAQGAVARKGGSVQATHCVTDPELSSFHA